MKKQNAVDNSCHDVLIGRVRVLMTPIYYCPVAVRNGDDDGVVLVASCHHICKSADNGPVVPGDWMLLMDSHNCPVVFVVRNDVGVVVTWDYWRRHSCYSY